MLRRGRAGRDVALFAGNFDDVKSVGSAGFEAAAVKCPTIVTTELPAAAMVSMVHSSTLVPLLSLQAGVPTTNAPPVSAGVVESTTKLTG